VSDKHELVPAIIAKHKVIDQKKVVLEPKSSLQGSGTNVDEEKILGVKK